jgi:hypothetical protein
MRLARTKSDSYHSNNRPYINDSYYVIEEIAIENWENPLILQNLLLELNRRSSDFALDLRSQIEEKLEELRSECFRFPRTDTKIGLGELEIKDRDKKGLLQIVGYARGQKAIDMGLDRGLRRAILEDVYIKNLPKGIDINDIDKWGNLTQVSV